MHRPPDASARNPVPSYLRVQTPATKAGVFLCLSASGNQSGQVNWMLDEPPFIVRRERDLWLASTVVACVAKSTRLAELLTRSLMDMSRFYLVRLEFKFGMPAD
jgi:hypothetical protein